MGTRRLCDATASNHTLRREATFCYTSRMIYREKPEGFVSKFEVVSCFFEDPTGRILLLHRHDAKPQGGTWGVPAGKVDAGESLTDALAREIREEIQYDTQPDTFNFLHTVYVTFPEYSFIYHMYRLRLNGAHEVVIKLDEHQDFRWVTPQEALTMNLIQDEAPCIELCYGPFEESQSLVLARQLLGKEVTVTMDRPLGSKHPKHGFIYEANYGYIAGVQAPDGEDLDAYYLGTQEPLAEAAGVCIAIAHRKDNDDDKLIVVPKGTEMTDEAIMAAITFQEKWFDTVIVR